VVDGGPDEPSGDEPASEDHLLEGDGHGQEHEGRPEIRPVAEEAEQAVAERQRGSTSRGRRAGWRRTADAAIEPTVATMESVPTTRSVVLLVTMFLPSVIVR
jgi:hypothetical protein